jgi:hypothetical protein
MTGQFPCYAEMIDQLNKGHSLEETSAYHKISITSPISYGAAGETIWRAGWMAFGSCCRLEEYGHSSGEDSTLELHNESYRDLRRDSRECGMKFDFEVNSNMRRLCGSSLSEYRSDYRLYLYVKTVLYLLSFFTHNTQRLCRSSAG